MLVTWIAALDAATGEATPWNPRATTFSGGAGDAARVRALAAAPPNLYVAGDFHQIGGRDRRGFAALDMTTGRATAWDPASENEATCIAATASTVFLADLPGGAVQALDPATAKRRWRYPFFDRGHCSTLHASEDTLFLGGTFVSAGLTSFAAFDLRSG